MGLGQKMSLWTPVIHFSCFQTIFWFNITGLGLGDVLVLHRHKAMMAHLFQIKMSEIFLQEIVSGLMSPR